jgi:hypothetical protein
MSDISGTVTAGPMVSVEGDGVSISGHSELVGVSCYEVGYQGDAINSATSNENTFYPAPGNYKAYARFREISTGNEKTIGGHSFTVNRKPPIF